VALSACCSLLSIPVDQYPDLFRIVPVVVVVTDGHDGTVRFLCLHHTDGLVSTVGCFCCSCWMATMALSALVVVGDRTDGHHGTVRLASASCGGYNSTSTPVLRVANGHVDSVGRVAL
jgi:hypothetical protein